MRKGTTARLLGALSLAGVVMITSACSSGGGSETAAPSSGPALQVFMSMGQTGLLAPSAKAVIRGAQAAVDSINKDGGLQGRKIKVQIGDNQSDPTRGVTLVQDAIASDAKPDLVVTGVSSNEALALAPVLSRSEVVGIGPASSLALNDPVKYPYFWSQSAAQQYLIAGVADYVKKAGGKKITFVGTDDALGDAIADALHSGAEKDNLTITEHRFKADAVDVTPAFQAAVADKPDFIYMDAAGTQAGTLLTSREKGGATGIDTIAGVVMASQPLLDLAKGTDEMDKVKTVFLPTAFYTPPAKRSAQFAEFYKDVTAQGPLEVPLSTYAAGWDTIKIWADAVGQVKGDITGPSVRDQLNKLSPSHSRLFFKKTFPKGSNFALPVLGEFIIGTPTGTKDGMFTYTP